MVGSRSSVGEVVIMDKRGVPCWTVVIVLLVLASGMLAAESSTAEEPSKPHPCQRSCDGGKADRRTCRYQWLVENYLVLSRACFRCPSNVTDCSRQQCVAADGVTRSVRVINRQLPGPDIQVCEGDTVEVQVTNQMMMSEGLTIHWHGQRQRRSQFMDGVSMLTQCPIPAFSSFTYRFPADDAGTHFYHSHSGLFRGEGLFGPLIVRQSVSRDPQRALYDLDLPEHVMVLNDWPHVPVVEMYTRFFHSSNGSQYPDNILINGRGMYPSPSNSFSHSSPSSAPPPSSTSSSSSSSSSTPTTTPLARFDVNSDVRYRFRVINAGALRCPIQLSVDHHSLLLIASDGQPLKAVWLSSILIYSGERYDFVLHAKKDLAGQHWIRARGQDLCHSHQIQQLAILNYVDSHVTGDDVDKYPDESMSYQAPLTSEGPRFNEWFLDEDLPPTTSNSPPDAHAQIAEMTSLLPDDISLRQEKADRQIFLELSTRVRNNVHFHDPVLYPAGGEGYKTVHSPMVNNISNILPPAPLLVQPEAVSPDLICNIDGLKARGKNCDEEFCECVHVESAREGEVVELVVLNGNKEKGYTHPFHLHGYSYRLVAAERPDGVMSRERFQEMDRQGLIHRRLHRAPAKDTTPIPNGGYLVLRLLADNPGAWFMHCHIALHAELGMALTLKVTGAQGRLPSPPGDFPRCSPWPQQTSSPPRRHGDGDGDVNGQRDDVRGTPPDVKSSSEEDDSDDGAWVIPVLVTLVGFNVMVVGVAAFIFGVRQRRRRGPYELRQVSFLPSASAASSMKSLQASRVYRGSSDDECSSLLKD
ncbi:uncharacterized protein LOC143275365 isoform X2 [Babylonia areolata]|uniref:uncharacterized protein LOC143275365 isoform X2 n=1 Tax=Babylonia areolata TaxID=304850 RepID=UPI003FD6AB3D